jgi:hypothetical protein
MLAKQRGLGCLCVATALLMTATAGESARAVEVAPMPRAVEDTKTTRGHCEQAARGNDEPHKTNGVEWLVRAKVRALSSGSEVIDFHWSIKATSPRSPLIILEPSLDNPNRKATKAIIHAFPKGSNDGRVIEFTTDFPAPRDGFSNLDRLLQPLPREWFLKVKKGKTATGVTSIPVSQIKRELLTFYPAEFSETVPPKLYAQLNHEPEDRGIHHDLDAWTGLLFSGTLDVPELKKW